MTDSKYLSVIISQLEDSIIPKDDLFECSDETFQRIKLITQQYAL